jgi:hypothetical protein
MNHPTFIMHHMPSNETLIQDANNLLDMAVPHLSLSCPFQVGLQHWLMLDHTDWATSQPAY